MTDDGYTVPKKTAGDVAHAAVKAVLAAVPVVGGSGVELFQFVIQAPLEKRRVEWMERIGQGLARLEAKGIDIAGLCESEEFVSAVMYGSQIALRTHQEKKLEALRNAILNVAACSAPEEALQLMFLNFVDEFTEWHLKILKLFQAPPPMPNVPMGALSHVLETAFPELSGQREFYDSVWRELYLRSLVGAETLHAMASGSGLAQKQTTPIGDKLLAFIEAPKVMASP
jgi:hypothetical protein